MTCLVHAVTCSIHPNVLMVSIQSQTPLFKFHFPILATVQKHSWRLYTAAWWHLRCPRLSLEVSFGFLRALCRCQTQDTALMWTSSVPISSPCLFRYCSSKCSLLLCAVPAALWFSLLYILIALISASGGRWAGRQADLGHSCA